MKSLRSELSALLVRQHLVSEAFAEEKVSEMTDAQVAEQLVLYHRQGIAGVELSVEGPNPRAGNVSSTRFSRPATTTADPRHSTAFPNSGPDTK